MSSKKIATLHPIVKVKALRHKQKCKEIGINLLIYCGLRTMEEQAKLYAKGRTKPGKIVTNAPPGSSWHNFAAAYDAVEVKNGICLWEGPNWAVIGKLGKQEGMLWGGDWVRLKDRPHFEYHPGLTLKRARKCFRDGLELFPQEEKVETKVTPIILQPVSIEKLQSQSILIVVLNFLNNLLKR